MGYPLCRDDVSPGSKKDLFANNCVEKDDTPACNNRYLGVQELVDDGLPPR